MKLITILLFAALAVFAEAQTGNIHGVVVDSVSKQPVRKAVVRLQLMSLTNKPTPTTAEVNASPAKPATATTDISGAFSFDAFDAGKYQLVVMHPSYPATGMGSFFKTVFVEPGQTTQAVVELVPGAAISGRVMDEDGDPMENCSVTFQAAGLTGDQAFNARFFRSDTGPGEYRLYNITPGRYIVSAECPAAAFQPRRLSAGPDPPPAAAYPKQFYPAASTVEAAEVIELAPGAERPGLDFKMVPAPVTQVHVTVKGAAWTGKKDLVWQLTPVGQPYASMINSWSSADTSKDSLTIPKVFPGSYILNLIARGTSEGGTQRVDVENRPVEVVLPFNSAVSLSGKVEVVGSNSGHALPMNQIQVQVLPTTGFLGIFNTPGKIEDDGSFTFKPLFPGPSAVHVMAPGAFLKTLWAGSTEIKDLKLDLTNGDPGPLRLIISTDTATVAGTAPPGSMIAMAFAAGVRFRGTRSTSADANGQFKIDGLAPGLYRIGLTEDLGTLAERSALEISLEEGEVRTIELKAPANAQ